MNVTRQSSSKNMNEHFLSNMDMSTMFRIRMGRAGRAAVRRYATWLTVWKIYFQKASHKNYTGCFSGNRPYFWRTFLTLNYVDITKYTYFETYSFLLLTPSTIVQGPDRQWIACIDRYLCTQTCTATAYQEGEF